MKTKAELKEFIRKVCLEFLVETGPSAQGIIQPWLGPSFTDDEGVPVYDEDHLAPPHFKKP